jgi:hypothetical protein
MADKLLRHIPTGVIHICQPAFEQRSDFEPYEPPAPELEIPVLTKPSRAPRAPKQTEPPAPAPAPAIDESALSADASRNLPV